MPYDFMVCYQHWMNMQEDKMWSLNLEKSPTQAMLKTFSVSACSKETAGAAHFWIWIFYYFFFYGGNIIISEIENISALGVQVKTQEFGT